MQSLSLQAHDSAGENLDANVFVDEMELCVVCYSVLREIVHHHLYSHFGMAFPVRQMVVEAGRIEH